MNAIEQQFHKALLDSCDEAKSRCKYNATRFRQMISESNGVETAHRLLVADESQDGFATLLMCGRLDLTMEHIMLEPRFASLFTEEELRKAAERLGRQQHCRNA